MGGAPAAVSSYFPERLYVCGCLCVGLQCAGVGVFSGGGAGGGEVLPAVSGASRAGSVGSRAPAVTADRQDRLGGIRSGGDSAGSALRERGEGNAPGMGGRKGEALRGRGGTSDTREAGMFSDLPQDAVIDRFVVKT